MKCSRALLWLSFASLVLVLGACSDSTAPSSDSPADGSAAFDGTFDPSGGSFVLQRIDGSIPGRQPLHIELIGSNVQVDETGETVSVDVAMRNAGSDPLYAPATVWLNRFNPPNVWPLNADFGRDEIVLPGPEEPLGTYGFDYSELLGEDDVLESSEESQAKAWLFHDPGLGSFAFVAEAEFGMEPNRPVISGMLFSDENHNGVRDADEGPFLAGGVTVQYPDGSVVHAGPDERGFYRVGVREAGLYRVVFASALACPACICETTPNPLEVLLIPGPNGEPLGFEHADFGIYPGPCGSEMVTVIGVVTRIDDAVPVDGGVVIDLQLENGEMTKLFFDSLFTEPPPPQWRMDLYQVIASLELGDRVRAAGTSVPGGISLRELTSLDR